jgi:type VI protein secretion system component VasA
MRRVGLVLFLWLASATAALAADATALTAADVTYLTKLGQSQKDLAASRPTPQDLDQLHQLINDPATAGKPKAREEAVWKLLDHIQAQFLWCSDHPADKSCGGDKSASVQ